jgi:hypothetical protein
LIKNEVGGWFYGSIVLMKRYRFLTILFGLLLAIFFIEMGMRVFIGSNIDEGVCWLDFVKVQNQDYDYYELDKNLIYGFSIFY